ncbi:MAG: N-6 DNA methylase [Thiotrichaceae bacterium]|nr:N-6 DNA methylase [Thiotrichaceae bacterium]
MINPLPALAHRLWTPAPAFYAAGIAYPDYLLELTWLLLGRIAHEQIYAEAFPCAVWEKLWEMPEAARFDYYVQLLKDSQNLSDPHLAGIFQQAHTQLKNAAQLTQLIEIVCSINIEEYEYLAESYEQLLVLASSNAHSQYYLTPPTALVDSLVIALQPQAGESIQDPVAASASFLIAAEQYTHLSDEELESTAETQLLGKESDLVRVRLALMNCLLHDIYHHEQLPVLWEQTPNTQTLPPADVILSNLLFCNGSKPADNNLILKVLQAIYHNLTPQGRAAVIVPDSLLSASGNARQIRYTLLESCHLHTVLRLPENLFYPYILPAQVLFFHRAHPEKNTQVWFYDLRHQRQNFMKFISAYGDDPYALQRATSEDPYWKSLSREQLAAQGDNLDYAWIEEAAEENPPLWDMLEETISALEDLKSLLYADFDPRHPDNKTNNKT